MIDIGYGDVKRAEQSAYNAMGEITNRMTFDPTAPNIKTAQHGGHTEKSGMDCALQLKDKTGKYRLLPWYYAAVAGETFGDLMRQAYEAGVISEGYAEGRRLSAFLRCKRPFPIELSTWLAQHFHCSREEIIETFEPPAVRGIGADWVGNFGSVMQDYIDPDFDDGLMSIALSDLRDGAIQASFRALYGTEIEPGQDLGQRIAEEEAKLY